MVAALEFEKPIVDLETRATEQRAAGDIAEAQRTDARVLALRAETYARLTPWQKTQVARHPARPHFKDYVAGLIADFTPLSGDRGFGEDAAIVGGMGRFRDRPVMVIGHEKGSDTTSRVKHNFGMGRPEGYRKAARLMELAGRFGLPVLTLVDTAGAFPGIDAEERGQAEAIARATQTCLDLPVPMIAAIVGEGGSGGAVALAAANRVIMFEHAIYAVISPEGCASILWRGEEGRGPEAAEAMRITAADLTRLGIVDTIVKEPLGGAHRDPAAAIRALGDVLASELARLDGQPAAALRRGRREKFVEMGRAA
jgi:acetyl-CoA carboxylase carboxyl transferase subunit alpha